MVQNWNVNKSFKRHTETYRWCKHEGVRVEREWQEYGSVFVWLSHHDGLNLKLWYWCVSLDHSTIITPSTPCTTLWIFLAVETIQIVQLFYKNLTRKIKHESVVSASQVSQEYCHQNTLFASSPPSFLSLPTKKQLDVWKTEHSHNTSNMHINAAWDDCLPAQCG